MPLQLVYGSALPDDVIIVADFQTDTQMIFILFALATLLVLGTFQLTAEETFWNMVDWHRKKYPHQRN